MACQCGCATDVSSPESDTRPVGEGEERDLERVVEELESRVKQLEIERASA